MMLGSKHASESCQPCANPIEATLLLLDDPSAGTSLDVS